MNTFVAIFIFFISVYLIFFLYVITSMHKFITQTEDMQIIYKTLKQLSNQINSSKEGEKTIKITTAYNIYFIRFSTYEELMNNFEKFVQNLINYYEKHSWMKESQKLVQYNDMLTQILINIRKDKWASK